MICLRRQALLETGTGCDPKKIPGEAAFPRDEARLKVLELATNSSRRGMLEGVTLLAQKRTALLAATCYNTTLENITVVYKQIDIPTDAASGATDECGLLVARQINTAVTMRNITLNAPGLTVPCVLGYEVGEVVFINVVVNAGEVLSLGSAQQWSPTATQLEDVSGVTVNEGVTALQSAPALPAKKYVF